VEITEVRVKLMEEAGERLQAFCSITFDDAFVVRDLKIIEGATGPFVAMPSRKLTAHCPQCGCKNHLRAAYCNQCGARQREQHALKDDDGRVKLYADIAHPINSCCREMVQLRVIQAYEEEKARSKLPGYVPTYDDLDDDPGWTPAAPADRGEPQKFSGPKIDAAGRPRGPHQPPSAPQRGHRPEACPETRPEARPETRVNDSFGAGIFD
jgi:stage V sporulation protein G